VRGLGVFTSFEKCPLTVYKGDTYEMNDVPEIYYLSCSGGKKADAAKKS